MTCPAALVRGRVDPRLRLLDWRKAKKDVRIVPDCIGKPVDNCIVVRGSGKRVLLMGDSHARMWVPAFTQIAQKEGLTLALAADLGCPWQRGLQYNLSLQIADDCSRHQTDWYHRVVPQFDPDVLILVHQAYDDPARPHGIVAPDGDLEFPQDADFERMLFDDATTASLRSLRRPGRTIVLGEPIPESRNGFDPLELPVRRSRTERLRLRGDTRCNRNRACVPLNRRRPTNDHLESRQARVPTPASL